MANKLIYNQKSFLQFSKDFNKSFPVKNPIEIFVLRPSHLLNHVRTGTLNSVLINTEI